MGDELYRLTAHEIRDAYRSGEATVTAVVQSYLDRIAAVDSKVGAYLDVWRDTVLEDAARLDESFKKGEELGPLAGVPVALKDLLCTRRGTTTCGSRILQGYRSPYDATVVEKLAEADVVFLGKVNMDEFAMGSSTENSGFQLTRNPWNLDCVPGGSSGGSAASVAADETAVALGSDTGGSIRQPAACCGCVGLKPTYGRVSRFGLVAYASSLDQIGPLAKDTEDIALLMNAISGRDPRDSTSADIAVPDFTEALNRSVDGITIGMPKEYFTEDLGGEVRREVEGAIAHLESQGAKVKEISLPHTQYTVAAYYIIATAEASANLARYDGVRYGYRGDGAKDVEAMYCSTKSRGFGPEVQRRVLLGTYVLSSGYYDAYYLKAQKVRSLIRRDFTEAFQECDVVATPTMPTPPFRIGEKANDPMQMYLTDVYTTSANLAGIPGISLPCGRTQEGLPVGLQLLGKPFDEETLITLGHVYEQTNALDKARPPL